MMNHPFLSVLTGFAAVLAPCVAFAGAEGGGSPLAGSVVVSVMLILVVVCLVLALKIFSLLKGGELASAWQILAIAFMILLIAEGVKLIDILDIANLGDTASMLIRLAGISIVMLGISKIKRVLS